MCTTPGSGPIRTSHTNIRSLSPSSNLIQVSMTHLELQVGKTFFLHRSYPPVRNSILNFTSTRNNIWVIIHVFSDLFATATRVTLIHTLAYKHGLSPPKRHSKWSLPQWLFKNSLCLFYSGWFSVDYFLQSNTSSRCLDRNCPWLSEFHVFFTCTVVLNNNIIFLDI